MNSLSYLRLGTALLFILSCDFLHAQPLVTLGNPSRETNVESKFYLAKGDEILAIKVVKKGTLTLQKLDPVTLAQKRIMFYGDFPEWAVVEGVMRLSGKYYLFYTNWENEEEQLFAREIDLARGEFVQASFKILSVNHKLAGIVKGKGFSFSVHEKYSFFFSSDSSRILIQYRHVTPSMKKMEDVVDVIGFAVFDQSLRPIWTREVRMPTYTKKMVNLGYGVSRDGTAYAAIAMRTGSLLEDEVPKSGDVNYRLAILKINGTQYDSVGTELKLPGKGVHSVRINESPDGRVVCNGFYNTKGTKWDKVEGIFSVSLARDALTQEVRIHEFPISILNQNMSDFAKAKNERQQEKGKGELPGVELSEIVFDKNGDILIVGEQKSFSYSAGVTMPNGGSTVGTSSIHFDDIVATKLSSSGDLQWMKRIPKRQLAYGEISGLSFRYFREGKKHFFLYLDKEKNKDLKPGELPAPYTAGREAVLVATVIDDESGEVSKTILLNTSDVEGKNISALLPMRMLVTRPGELFVDLWDRYRKETRLLKVLMR